MKNKTLLSIFITIICFNLIGCNHKEIQNETPKELMNIEGTVNNTDLLFNISSGNKDCIPVQLVIYKDGKYEFYYAYKAPKEEENTNDILIYSKSSKGTYEYDVSKILENSIDANNKSYDMTNLPKYEIYTAEGKYYTIEKNTENEYLNEFLEQIKIDLNTCAEKDYY